MVEIDMTKPDRDLTPGVDLWRIAECVSRRSSGGDRMLAVKFRRVADDGDHLFDNIMLEGPGWGIGKSKLGALLPKDYKGDLDPLDLVDRRLWVETTVDEYQGKQRLKVDIQGLKHCGLQAEDDPPPGAVPSLMHADDTPF